MIVVVDNYDSFTYNLVQLIESSTASAVEVIRNDAFDVEQVLAGAPEAIVISPGPGVPTKAGRIIELIRANGGTPLLGVCLGHQAIGEAFGATVVRAPLPVHGKTSAIRHSGTGLFAGFDEPLVAVRYHSLVIDRATLPDDLRLDAETDDGLVMAVSHRQRPTYGIQFHPESYATRGGRRIVENFLAMARADAPDVRAGLAPALAPPTPDRNRSSSQQPGDGRKARPYGSNGDPS